MVVAAIVVGAVSIAVVVPRVGFRVGIGISFRSGFSFPLLAAIESIAIVAIGSIVAAIVVRPVSIAIVVPGVSLRVSIRVSYWGSLSFPLLAAIVSKAIVAMGPIAIVSTIVGPVAIVVPWVSIRASLSHCISLSLRGSQAQTKQAQHNKE